MAPAARSKIALCLLFMSIFPKIKPPVSRASSSKIQAYNHPQNQVECGRKSGRRTGEKRILSADDDHPTLREFLFSLMADSRLLGSVAKNKRSQCEATFRRWKDAGYPHPGDWPCIGYRQIVSFSYKWLTSGPF